MYKPVICAAMVVAMGCGVNAYGQTLQERVANIRMQKRIEQGKMPGQTKAKLRKIFKNVSLNDVPAREALEKWSQRAEIKLIINWRQLELDGVDQEQPITLELDAIPAEQLLELILRQMSPETKLVRRDTDWYIAVMTKRQANRHRVVRVYHIGELTMDIPNFTNAPSFDLNDALSNTSSGGSGGSSSRLFDDSRNEDRNQNRRTKQQRGEDIAELVMQTVEPDIWVPNGPCTAKYYRGNLIVSAPEYVHAQIGVATSGSMTHYQGRANVSRRSSVGLSTNVIFTRQKMRRVPVFEMRVSGKTNSVDVTGGINIEK